MKKLIIGLCALGSTLVFAADHTDMANKWVCTTNATTSAVASENAADEQMRKTQGSASQSFTFAAQNCRDCTKISCEVKN